MGYCSVHFGKSLLWAGEDALALYILVQFLKLPPAAAGLMFLLSALWNALCDGLFGRALHRWPTLNLRLPIIAGWALTASALGFALLPLSGQGNVLAAIGLLFLFRTGFSLADVPHNALTNRFTETQGNLGVARLRALGSASAALIIGLATFSVLLAGAGGASLARWLIGAIGATAVLLMSPLPFMLARDNRDFDPVPRTAMDRRVNSSLLAYCFGSAIGFAGLAAAGKAMLHLDLGSAGAAVVLVVTSGRLAAIPIWMPVARRIGNRRALALAFIATGIATPFLSWLAGIGAVATWLGLILFSLLGGGIGLLCWAVLSEIIGGERSGGAGRYAAEFGLFTMSMKIGLGASAAIAGLWLSTSDATIGIRPATFLTLGMAATASCFIAAAVILMMRRGPADEPALAIP